MATTTNYSWTTPDDTDLVKDGAAAIRTLGTAIDTTTKNLNPSTTTGDIEYRSSTTNVNTRLALGTAGQVLTVNSGATAPEWATPAPGGGKVLQVINATTTTETSSSTSTYVDSTLTATITPSSATSTILVFAFLDTQKNNNSQMKSRLVRDSTEISIMAIQAGFTNDSAFNNVGTVAITYKDSPATTAATSPCPAATWAPAPAPAPRSSTTARWTNSAATWS
jgi:hypothetical protein